MRHMCLYIGVQIFIAYVRTSYGCTGGSTRGSTRGPRGPKNIPPVSLEKEMVDVSVSIDILKLVDIDEEDYSIEMQFSITLGWFENRAKYQNLKKKRSLNVLTQEDIELLWLPKVIYENTDQKESTRLGTQWEWETSVVVEREKNGTFAGLETDRNRQKSSGVKKIALSCSKLTLMTSNASLT